MTGVKETILVKQSDMIGATSLLQLLVDAIDRLKDQMKDPEFAGIEKKYYMAGAIESLTDLHNLILQQVSDARSNEVFDAAKKGEGFDA